MGDRQIEMQDETWRVRIGQIQTVLSYFGSVCSVSIGRHDGIMVYVQAQRLEGSLECVPPQRLIALADQQEGEAVGMLRNRRCPDDLVLRYILARSAPVRYAALAATKRRNLPIDSALIRAARDLPMVDRKTFPYADRARAIADQILAAR